MNNLNERSEHARAPNSLWISILRKLSILAAIIVCGVIILYPRLIAAESTQVPHGWLVMLLMGMSLCWIFGFGLTPKNRLLAALIPIVGWIFLLIATWKVFF